MKPIVQIICSVILTIVICQVSYMVLDIGLNKYDTHKNKRLSELFLKNDAYDILFIGSSRTHTDIYPKVIDSICDISSYNAGVEGGNLLEFEMTLKAYLQNHPPPKYLVLTIDLNSFNLKRKFFNYFQYFPYVQNKIIKQTLNENGHNTAIAKIFPFLILTHYDDYTKANAIKGLNGLTEIPFGDFEYEGYLSNTENHIKGYIEPYKLNTVEISEAGVAYLQEIINLCNESHIKLIFTYAPEFKLGLQKQVSNSKVILDLIANTAQKNNIPFFNDASISLSNNPELFANPGHLNKHGAYVYSIILAHKIKEAADNINFKNKNITLPSNSDGIPAK